MEITIGKKEYELVFGLDFIASLDKSYTQNADGMEFGLGVESAIPYLKMQNPTVLINIIKAGTSHLNTKPSNKGINDFLTGLAEDDKLDDFFVEVEDNMRVAPFLKSKMKTVDSNVANLEAVEKRSKKKA